MVAFRKPSARVMGHSAVMDERDDVSLLTAIAQQGDRAALSEICERYQKRAFNIAFRILRNSQLAEDAVQDALLSIWLSARTFQPQRGDAQGWILSIVTNKSLTLGTQQKQRAKREERIAMERSTEEGAASERIEADERIVTLRNHLDQLPELESRLLACCYGANMSHRKIGEALGIPQQTVSYKIQQALERLRGSLTGAGVAAIMPLLSTQNLFEAMTSGRECPPGVTARVLSRAMAKSAAVTSRHVRRAAPKSGGRIIALAAAVMAVGGIWLAVQAPGQVKPPNPAPVAPQPVAKPPEVKAPAEQPLYARWSFENGPSPELTEVQGIWQWMRNDDKSPGFMASALNQYAMVVLPPRIPATPVLVTVKLQWRGQKGMTAHWANQAWWDGKAPLKSTERWRIDEKIGPNFLIPANRLERVYFIDRFVFMCVDQTIHIIEEYSQPYRTERLRIGFENFDVQEIELRSLKPEEIPEALRDPEKLIADLKRRKTGVVKLEPLLLDPSSSK